MNAMVKIIILIQAGLLAIELLTTYDTLQRQIALSVTNIIGTAGLLWLDRRLRRRGQRLSWVTVGIVIGAIWLDALGNFQHFFAQYWWYDRLSHATGGMAVSAVFIDLFVSRFRQGHGFLSWGIAAWFGFMFGQFVGAMYEISEWLGDWWFQTERVRGLYDAPRDLWFNLIGGLAVLLFFWLTRKKALADSSKNGIIKPS